jgi:hypothetical protein
MSRAVLAIAIAFLLISVAYAQDDFTPGSDDTLDWKEPAKGLEQMVEDIIPGIIYFYSAHQAEFCKAIEKDIIPQKSLKSKFKKLVCIKLSSDKDSDTLDRYKIEQGQAVVLFLDSQGAVAETLKEKPDLAAFKKGISKAEKANKPIKKFLDAIEKSYKKGVAYFKKKAYLKAAQYFQAILKAHDDYEEKKGEIKSEYFEKAEKKLEEVKLEGTKLLIKANAAIMKDDFGNASMLLSELRAQFALFPNIITKVEQAEEDLQRRMQRANQGK